MVITAQSLFWRLPGLVALLAMPSLVQAGPPPDFNGDGYADLAVGVPGETVGGIAYAGAVNVIYGSAIKLTSAGSQFWTQEDFKITSTVGSLFAASLAWGDFNGDTMTDLAIGAPGAGRLFVLYGRSSGLSAESGQAWPGNCGSFAGALAAGDFDGDGYSDLAVGAPLCTLELPGGGFIPPVPAVKASGIVVTFRGGIDGLVPVFAVRTLRDFSMDRMPDDHFGAALAAGDFNGDGRDDLAVGIPERDFTSIVVDAGAVGIYYGATTGRLLRLGTLMFQENGGTHVNEAADHFGRALAAGDFNGDGFADLAVGVPFENVGSIANAGAVHVIHGSYLAGLRISGNKFFTENNGSLGTSQKNDAFGTSVVAGDFDGNGYDDLGVPGQDRSGIADAGAMHVLYGRPASAAKEGSQLWSQNSPGIADDPEPGDVFGAGRYGHMP